MPWNQNPMGYPHWNIHLKLQINAWTNIHHGHVPFFLLSMVVALNA